MNGLFQLFSWIDEMSKNMLNSRGYEEICITTKNCQEGWMQRLKVGDLPPEFSLPDHHGVEHQLSEMVGKQNVLLVFNFGFV